MRSNPYRVTLVIIWVVLTLAGAFTLYMSTGHQRNGTVGLADITWNVGSLMLTAAAAAFLVWLGVSAVLRGLTNRGKDPS